MSLEKNASPAILSYEGIQYQYMAPTVMEQDWLTYLQEHLRILSGFYGILKPFDGVVPYRLEMQAKAAVGGKKDLYDYWGDQLYRELTDGDDHVILNLASKEYSRCVERYLQPEDTFITVIFGEWSGEKVVQKGTLAKMARGEMVRFIAENQWKEPEEIQSFASQGYRFHKDLSDDTNYVFLRQTPSFH